MHTAIRLIGKTHTHTHARTVGTRSTSDVRSNRGQVKFMSEQFVAACFCNFASAPDQPTNNNYTLERATPAERRGV